MGLLDALFGTRSAHEQRSLGPSFSISDPALAEYLGISTRSISGVSVSETTSLGVTAFYRCVALISGTIAGLPLKTYRRLPDDGRERVASWLDRPAGPYPLVPFDWVRLILNHGLVRGESFLLHIYDGTGSIVGAWPVHPSAVEVKWQGADKVYKVRLADGSTREYSSLEMSQFMGLTMDGTRGISPLTVFRHAIGLGIAADTAAGRTYGNGMMIAGLVTTADGVDVTEEEAKVIKEGLTKKLTGVENAGDIAFVNRSLKFTPWSMTNEDAQFLESRSFQIEEFARMFGVPPHLLAQTEKQTSWGTGVAEQNLGLQKYTLASWTSPLEQLLSTLLPDDQFCEFDYKGLLQGTPAQEIELLIAQVTAGLLTEDEARALLNRPPIPESEKPALPAPTPLKESA